MKKMRWVGMWKSRDYGPWSTILWIRLRRTHFPTFILLSQDYLSQNVRKILDTNDLHKQGNVIDQIFWGLWLLPLGILVFKFGFFPKILGVLQVIACFGYLANFLADFLFPGILGKIGPIYNVMAFGELPFILWLIIRGARLKPFRSAAPAAA